MGETTEKPRLADRTEAILRSDRTALQKQARRQPAILLTVVPDNGPVIDFMDAYMPDVADMAGLQYVKMVGPEQRELPAHMLERTFLVLADVTGRDENVITLVYQALGLGRRVLLSAQAPEDLPQELEQIPHVTYDLSAGMFETLLQAVRQASFSAMEEAVSL
ncbi:MAG TPA: hypothetical protein VNT01_16980 [Symbiobacteriaceae bacterium]|nr:hypothetical protein [Symbiobacteriaceae bacterium]